MAQAPTFILLHGFAQTPRAWEPVAGMLQSQGAAVAAPSLYDALPGHPSMAAICDYVAEFVEAAARGDEGVRRERGAQANEGVCGEGEACAETHACADGEAQGERDTPGEGEARADGEARWIGDDCRSECVAAAAGDGNAEASHSVVLVGYSMGGRIAAQTLARHPGLPVAAVVLESAGLGPADEGERAAFAQRNGEWANRLRADGAEAFMAWWETLPLFASQRRLPPDARRRVADDRAAHDAELLARSLEGWGAQHQAPRADTVRALRSAIGRGADVRYVVGELDEKYRALSDGLAAEGVPVAVVPGAGHNVHLERPDAFAALLEETARALS